MSKCLLSLIMALILVQCQSSKNENPQVVISTNYGDIEIELYPQKAPKTVAAFLSYIDSGYYQKSAFYRVLLTKGMAGDNYGLIQGGTWQSNNIIVPGIPHESTKQSGLSHTTGTVSMARTKPGTAGTEFFICIGDQRQFDYGNEQNGDREGFAAFGKVIKGMKVVREIQKQPSQGESLTPVVKIISFRRS